MDDREEIAREKRARDYADSMDESAGRDTGKMRRFISDRYSPDAQQQRRTDDRRFIETLTRQDQIQQLQRRLDELDRQTAQALRDAEERAEKARRRCEDMDRAATRDRFGRIVFRSEDGQHGFYADGTEITASELAAIDWKPGATSWETRQRTGDEYSAATGEVELVRRRREHLNEHRQTLEGVPSERELLEMDRELAALPTLQPRLGNQSRQSAASEHIPDDTFADAPKASDAFATAANPAEANEELSRTLERERAPPRPGAPGATA